MSYADDLPETRGYPGWAILLSAAVGIIATVALIWAANGFGPFYETLFRVDPTVTGGGVGADWLEGNTIGYLDFLIAITHAADVLMGVFILFMVFLHWASFRRLAARMRQPGEREEGAAVADGGDAPRTDGGAAENDDPGATDRGDAS